MAMLCANHIDDLRTILDDAVAHESRFADELQPGDSTAFEALLEWYRNSEFFRRSLGWMGGSHEDAEDALNDAMLSAWRHLPESGDAITNLKAWFYRVLYNQCMTLHKAEQNRQRRFCSAL